MKKLNSNFIASIMVFVGISVLAAVVLTATYVFTKESIDNVQLKKQLEVVYAVLPPFDHVDSKPIVMNDGVETMKVYKAYAKNDEFIGAAVESSSNNGYRGHIDVMVGFNKAGVIVNYTVLEQNETPGLGSKMQEWFRTDYKNQNIIGKNPATANLIVSKEGGEVDAITSATISSRAFLFAVRNAYFAFVSQLDQTPKVKNDSILHTPAGSASGIDKSIMKGQKQ